MNKENKKEVLVYSIELLVFGVIFLVLSILILVGIIPIRGTFRRVLIYISMVGSLYIVFNFFWSLFSKKKRKKSPLIDTILALPAGISVFIMDILTFVQGFDETVELHETFVGYLFLYLAIVYLFESIYHYFKPIPYLIEDDNEDKKKVEEIKEDKKVLSEEEVNKRLEEMSNKNNENASSK